MIMPSAQAESLLGSSPAEELASRLVKDCEYSSFQRGQFSREP
jgi:hypothetical protein